VRNGAARFCARGRPCIAPLHTLRKLVAQWYLPMLRPAGASRPIQQSYCMMPSQARSVLTRGSVATLAIGEATLAKQTHPGNACGACRPSAGASTGIALAEQSHRGRSAAYKTCPQTSASLRPRRSRTFWRNKAKPDLAPVVPPILAKRNTQKIPSTIKALQLVCRRTTVWRNKPTAAALAIHAALLPVTWTARGLPRSATLHGEERKCGRHFTSDRFFA
jgi:hypothetical protein